MQPARSSHPTHSPAVRPNLLLVIADDLSAANLACYGNPDSATPNFDRFAAEGLRFNRAYTACPQCMPARAALLTGRSPVGMQMTRFNAPLPAEIPTFPEVLKARGYFTGAVGRDHHLDGDRNPASAPLFAERALRTFSKRLDVVRRAENRNTEEIFEHFEAFLQQAPAEKPFFLQLNFFDPHRPFFPERIPSPRDPAALALPSYYPPTARVRRDLAHHYDAVNRLDADFGRLLARLDQTGLAANTIVVFTADHGASQFRGKGTLFEPGIRIPLLIRWPGTTPRASVSDDLISGEDLAPTLLEAAGAPPPPGSTGVSFLGRLLGESQFAGRDHLFSERGAHGSSLPNNTVNFDLSRTVVTHRYKLIYNALWQLPFAPVDFQNSAMWKEIQTLNAQGALSALHSRLYFSPTRPMFELFDVGNDPDELNNLAGCAATADIEARLKQTLHEWMILERDYVPLPIPRAPIKGLDEPEELVPGAA
ncbi:MAG: sulfatase [Chthoniobacteraceae bacterium]